MGGALQPLQASDEPLDLPCATCGRTFEALRMAIHARSCARTKQAPANSVVTAQQRAHLVLHKGVDAGVDASSSSFASYQRVHGRSS